MACPLVLAQNCNHSLSQSTMLWPLVLTQNCNHSHSQPTVLCAAHVGHLLYRSMYTKMKSAICTPISDVNYWECRTLSWLLFWWHGIEHAHGRVALCTQYNDLHTKLSPWTTRSDIVVLKCSSTCLMTACRPFVMFQQIIWVSAVRANMGEFDA